MRVWGGVLVSGEWPYSRLQTGQVHNVETRLIASPPEQVSISFTNLSGSQPVTETRLIASLRPFQSRSQTGQLHNGCAGKFGKEPTKFQSRSQTGQLHNLSVRRKGITKGDYKVSIPFTNRSASQRFIQRPLLPKTYNRFNPVHKPVSFTTALTGLASIVIVLEFQFRSQTGQLHNQNSAQSKK